MSAICRVHHLGLMEYRAAWELQKTWAAEIAAGARPPTLLLLEHPHIYTFGRRGHEENLLWDARERARRGVDLAWVDRGGDVTYHGPGQLVGYPLLPLAPGGLRAESASPETPRLPRADYVGYLRRLEEVVIQTLAEFGISAFPVAGMTGVWVRSGGGEAAKIAAIGVKVDARGVSRHGFALNVAPDMAYWGGIIGCGLRGRAVTSMAQALGAPPPMPAVRAAAVRAFGRVFAYQMEESTHAA